MLGLIAIIVGVLAVTVAAPLVLFGLQSRDKILNNHKSDSNTEKQHTKKYNEANTSMFSGTFVQVGLIVVTFLVILAFQWKTYEGGVADLGTLAIPDEIEIEPPQTKQEKPPPPPPPPPQIEIVEDEEILEEEPIIEDEPIEDEPIEAPPPMEEEVIEEPEIFTIVEKMPSFPGGDAKLMQYITKNIRYPNIARENNIEGLVVVTFVVMEDGSIKNIKVLRDIGGGCGDEAVRVVESMPAWQPGEQRGKPVRVQFNLPVRFKLD